MFQVVFAGMLVISETVIVAVMYGTPPEICD
jgi:hypothetical protein